MKLPKLPNKASVLEAKYTAEQMRKYATKALEENAFEQFVESKPLFVGLSHEERNSIIRDWVLSDSNRAYHLCQSVENALREKKDRKSTRLNSSH